MTGFAVLGWAVEVVSTILTCKVVLYFEYILIFITVLLKQYFCGCLGSVACSNNVICCRGREMGYTICQHLTAFLSPSLSPLSLSLSLSLSLLCMTYKWKIYFLSLDSSCRRPSSWLESPGSHVVQASYTH